MRSRTICRYGAILGLGFALACRPAAAGSLLTNGGFEDLNSTFVDQNSGCMALYANSTAIAGWAVSGNVTRDIAWCNGASAGYPAAEGSYWVDLTGFGNDSPNGAIRQTISVTPGDTYTIGFLWADISTGNPGVDIDGVPIVLHTPTGYNFQWTYVEGTFVATDPAPYLEFFNASPGTDAMVIDAGSLTLGDNTGNGGGLPEPGTLALLGLALTVLAALRGKERRYPRHHGGRRRAIDVLLS